MELRKLDWSQALAGLDDGITLVTGNARLTRRVLAEHALRQQKSGRTIWPRADVLPWGAWLKRLHEAALARGLIAPGEPSVLLSQVQVDWVWRQVIEWDLGNYRDQADHGDYADRGGKGNQGGRGDHRDPVDHRGQGGQRAHEGQGVRVAREVQGGQGDHGDHLRQRDQSLLQPAAAARQAREARELCLEWQIDRGRLRRAVAGHEDGVAFLRWSDAFAKRLAAGGWLEPAALPDRVGIWLERAPALRPVGLYLAGFEEFSPQQWTLLERLLDWGVDVAQVQPGGGPLPQVLRRGCADAEQEMRAAARWARARLEAHPAGRVGIVVRDLQDRRSAMMRELDAALHPSACRQPGHRGARAWNLSLGRPLADEPAVHDALRWLALARGNDMPFADVGRLLRSPFLAASVDEQKGRLALEIRLRGRREPRVALETLIRLGGGGAHSERGEALCPVWTRLVEQLCEQTRSLPARQSPGAWALHFAQALTQAGWPGQRPLDSHEFQVVQAWQGLLQELTGLGVVQPTMVREEALSALRQLAKERNFQPQAVPAPVQVLGWFEALGQTFDALWIMGLHDGVWPEPPRPNPFLPSGLQRELQLPHASAARELAYAERLTADLLALAPEVVVSWPRRQGDEPLRPSPLIVSLPEAPQPSELDPDPWRRMLAADQSEMLLDAVAPMLAEGVELRGGTSLLKDQSHCPFRAFAIHRLQAKPLDSPEEGLDALLRGELVHRILRTIWEHLKSRQNLAALTEVERAALITEQVTLAIAWAARKHPSLFPARFAEVERTRLEALVDEWLQLDLARPDFTVQAWEHEVNLPVGGIKVKGILDRVDRLDDGRLVVIDYKTGDVKPKDWFGTRPRDPQIPLYSLSFGPELGGLAVGRVRRHDCAWTGLVVDSDQLPGSQRPEDLKAAAGLGWEEVRAQWAAMAEELARGHQAGDARVDPLPKACEYCHLTGLCRVHEIGLQHAMDEDE